MIAGDLQPRELAKRWLKESIALEEGCSQINEYL
jgi:hypothetical protein